MKRYQRILVCIDQPERDLRMLSYAWAVARLAESKEIHLLHVTDDKAHGFDDLPQPSSVPDEVTSETLRALVLEHIEEPAAQKCLCEVIHGSPLLEILRFAYERDIDLIIVGRHYGEGAGTDDDALQARRITRKATCSVLVLPEEHQIKADTILVPVRNSECSANALDVACGISAATNAKVIALNVYQVHAGYSRSGVSLEQHQLLLDEAAQRESGRLLERVDTRSVAVRCTCVPSLHGKPVQALLESITTFSVDLVVIGARGRTGAAGVLLGNVTEQLIRRSPVPVLAVKKKGECLGVLRALLSLSEET